MSELPEFEELTEAESDDFRNLLFIGRLSETVDVLGHPIALSTLSTEEDLAIGLVTKPYIGSDSYQRAYRTAIVAAAIRSIDGEPLVLAISGDTTTLEIVQAKFDKVKKYYPIFLDAVYERFTELEKKLLPVVSRLGKRSS